LDYSLPVMWFLLGVFTGLLIAVGYGWFYKIRQKIQFSRHVETSVLDLKQSFTEISEQIIAKTQERFLQLSYDQLKNERDVTDKLYRQQKDHIQTHLTTLDKNIKNMCNIAQSSYENRQKQLGEIGKHLEQVQDQTLRLHVTTNELVALLKNNQNRGLWGERIAQDILNHIGFVENINYLKQKPLADDLNRPDYIFFLPKGYRLAMDVKFPLANYHRWQKAVGSQEQEALRKVFVRDLKLKLKELTDRNYINKEQQTLDLVLMFIPTEQIYQGIHMVGSEIIDESLKRKVVICSPYSLFAILLIIRQATEYFSFEKSSHELLNTMIEFGKNWKKFSEKFNFFGKKLEIIQKEFESLKTTRTRQLDRPLDKIKELQQNLLKNHGNEKI